MPQRIRASSSRTISRNTLAILSVTLTSKVARVAVFFMIALALPAAQVGQWSLAWATVEIVAGLTDFGVDWVVIRRLSLDPDNRGRILACSVAARLVLSAAAYTLAVAATIALGLGQYALFLTSLAGLGLFARSVTGSMLSPLQADLSVSEVVGINIVTAAFYFLCVSLVLWRAPSLPVLVLAAVVTDFMTLALTSRITRRRTVIAWPPNWRATKGLLTEAAPLGVSAIFVAAYFRLDTLILARIAGLTSVAFYSIAYRSTESFLLIATAFGNSIYPVLSTRAQRGHEELSGPFQCIFCPLVTGIALVSLTISNYAEPLISRLVPKYGPAAFPIAVLIWSTVFMFANCVTGTTINALGRHRVFLRITTVNLAVNLGLNLLLIPQWQIVGACIATVATEAVNFVQQAIVLREIMARRVHSVWVLVLLAVGGAYLARSMPHHSNLVFAATAVSIALLSQFLGYYGDLYASWAWVRSVDASSH